MHKWYFVRCQSGSEDSIRKQVELRLKMAGVSDLVPQVLVPFERVTDLKGGKKRIVNRKLYPGYLMLQADLEEEAEGGERHRHPRRALAGGGRPGEGNRLPRRRCRAKLVALDVDR